MFAFRSAPAGSFPALVSLMLALMLAVSMLVPLSASAQVERAGLVTVVNGVFASEVDVYVNGADASYDSPLVTLEFGDLADLELLPAEYTFELFPAGSDPVVDPSSRLGEAATVTVDADMAYTVVLGLDSGAAPALFAFPDDLTPVAGEVRTSVRHLADAGPLSVTLNDDVVADGLAATEMVTAMLPAGDVTISLAEQTTPGVLLLGPDVVDASDVVAMTAYIVGDPTSTEEDSFGVIWATYTLDQLPDDTTTTSSSSSTSTSQPTTSSTEPPTGVPTGDGSALGGVSVLPLVAAFVGLVALVGLAATRESSAS